MTAESVNEDQARPTARQVGRLADSDSNLSTDPRINPTLLATLSAFGFAENSAPSPIGRDASEADRLALVTQTEKGFEAFYEALNENLLDDTPAAVREIRNLTGIAGNDIALHIYRPANTTSAIPGVVYLHGGGMTMLAVDNPVHQQWCEDLVSAGMVAIAVDFRNAGGARGPHPFPAGLNDCMSALEWIHVHRGSLGISSVVVQGESGGGNLALAVGLMAKQNGVLESIDGVYAMVPFISGGYGWPDERKLRDLPSMIENDGYFASCSRLDVLAATYDPYGQNAENPLCWPYFASIDDMTGLPPHVVSVNELDPLRDEGEAYYQKLMKAGVPSYGRVNLGLTHAAETIFRKSAREANLATIADIKRFALACISASRAQSRC